LRLKSNMVLTNHLIALLFTTYALLNKKRRDYMELRDRLKINPDRLDAINNILLNPDMDVINDFQDKT